MVGELVAKSKADTPGITIRTYQIKTDNLPLFAACKCKIRHREISLGRNDTSASAFVKPFGLDTELAVRGLAALKTHLENLH